MQTVTRKADGTFDSTTCQALFAKHSLYAQTALLTTQLQSVNQPDTKQPGIPVATCEFFGSVKHKPSARGAGAVTKVEHCNGIWRGTFPAFANATGNSFGASVVAPLEQVGRDFVIFGHLDELDNFVVRSF